MANVPLEAYADLTADLHTVATDTALGITHVSATCNCSTWQHWCKFCIALNLDEYLAGLADPIPVLQLYAHHY